MRLFLLERPAGGRTPQAGDTVSLSAEESHHLFHVLRSDQGEQLTLTDGLGWFYSGRLADRQGQTARVALEVVWQDRRELATPRLGLACGIVKGRRFEWVLEKAVELGAQQIWPLGCERGVVIPGAGRQDRWQAIVRAALKQSERSLLPQLHAAVDLATWLQELDEPLLFHGEAPAAPEPAGESPCSAVNLQTVGDQTELARAARQAGWLIWCVGPEGGWTGAELEQLRGVPSQAVRLGPHCLRSETAAVVGLGVLLQWRDSLLAG
ncbi:MAG: RsmE family RNA methyltransferase [bacterium]